MGKTSIPSASRLPHRNNFSLPFGINTRWKAVVNIYRHDLFCELQLGRKTTLPCPENKSSAWKPVSF
jgi:hypothetical protein